MTEQETVGPRKPSGERHAANARGSSWDLCLRAVTKHFGVDAAVDGISLDIAHGSFFALIGPSGCGKTTTLRMIAGLEHPSSGSILLGQQDITALPPHRRSINTVFQNYALFPHLNVAENVAFGPRRRGVRRVDKAVAEMLDLVELGHCAKRTIDSLSGGQQQRVALARALINDPQVLLLDEPLGALDLKLRRQMQLELKRIQNETSVTFILVTHDQEEAMTMADAIAVMNSGRIEQVGSPKELYERPSSAFVANFLGQSNLIDAKVERMSAALCTVSVSGHTFDVPTVESCLGQVGILIGVRPEKLVISTGSDETGGNVIRGCSVVDTSFNGMSTQFVVRTPWGQNLTGFRQNAGDQLQLVRGDAVTVHWSHHDTFVLEKTAPNMQELARSHRSS